LASTLTTFDAVLKEVYLEGIQDQLNSKDTAMNLMNKKDDPGGKYLKGPLRYGRNQGFGAVDGTAGTVPAAGAQQYDSITVPPKYHYGQIKVRKEVIEQSKSSVAAFARAMQTEMEGLPTDMKEDANREFLGNGTGNLAPGGVTTFSGTSIVLTDTADARKFGPNIRIDIWDNGGSATDSTLDTMLYQGVKVTVVNVDTGTLTVTGVSLSGTAANIMINRSGTRERDIRYEMLGLRAAVSASNPYLATSASISNIQGLNRSTATWFTSKVFSNSSVNRDISETLLQQTIDAVNIRGGGKVSFWLTTFGIRDAFEQTQLTLKRYPNTQKLPAGFTEDVDAGNYVPGPNNIPIVPDKHAPSNEVYAIDKRYLFIARLADWNWMDDDGKILHLCANNEPAYYANLFCFMETMVTQPNCCSVITDVTGTDPA
jgi:hypothetical protein